MLKTNANKRQLYLQPRTIARLKQQGNGTMITRRRRRKALSATLSQICCPRVNKPIGHDCNASYHSIIIYSLIPAFVPSYQLHCNCWKREAMFKWTRQWATHHLLTSSWTTYESIVHHQALNRVLCAPYCGSTALCNDAEIFHGFFALIGGLCNMLIFNHQWKRSLISHLIDYIALQGCK